MRCAAPGAAPVLEPAAAALAKATDKPPFLFELPPAEGPKAVDDLQSGDIAKPAVDEEWITVQGGPTGSVRTRIVKPADAAIVFPEYDLSPEVHYPVAIERNFAVAQWVVAQGATTQGLDTTRASPWRATPSVGTWLPHPPSWPRSAAASRCSSRCSSTR